VLFSPGRGYASEKGCLISCHRDALRLHDAHWSIHLCVYEESGSCYAPLQTRVEGEDCVDMILFIPIGTLNPNIQDAVDRAVEKVPNGDMMTNVTLTEDMLFTLIYNRVCVRVTGDVVNTRASGTIQQAPAAQGPSFVPRNPAAAPNPNVGDQWRSSDHPN